VIFVAATANEMLALIMAALLSMTTVVSCVSDGTFAQLTIVTQEPAMYSPLELAACAATWLAADNITIHVDKAFTTILYTVTSGGNGTAALCTVRMNESSTNGFICSDLGAVVALTKFEGYRPAAVPIVLLDAPIADWPQMLVFAVTAVGALLLVVQTALLCKFRCSQEYALSERHKRERIFF
jgi:hypothetical protein